MRMAVPLEKETSRLEVIKRNMGKYDDIINLDHPVSKNHPQMSIYDRSAQFAPFAALVGYDESINNAGKRRDSKISLSEDKMQEISESLVFISSHIKENITATITYFDKNEQRYLNKRGLISKIDSLNRTVKFYKGSTINFVDIIDIVVE